MNVCRVCGGSEEPPYHNAKCAARGWHDFDEGVDAHQPPSVSLDEGWRLHRGDPEAGGAPSA